MFRHAFLAIGFLLIGMACSKSEAPKPKDNAPSIAGHFNSDNDNTTLDVEITNVNELKFHFEKLDSLGPQTWVFDQVTVNDDLSFHQTPHNYALIWTPYWGEVFPFAGSSSGVYRENRIHFQSDWIIFDGRR